MGEGGMRDGERGHLGCGEPNRAKCQLIISPREKQFGASMIALRVEGEYERPHAPRRCARRYACAKKVHVVERMSQDATRNEIHAPSRNTQLNVCTKKIQAMKCMRHDGTRTKKVWAMKCTCQEGARDEIHVPRRYMR